MKRYEGVYFLAESIGEEEVEKAWKSVKGGIEKLGGKVVEDRFGGRRAYARVMKKSQGGYYGEVLFDLDPAKVDALRERYGLDDNVKRLMIVAAGDKKKLREIQAESE